MKTPKCVWVRWFAPRQGLVTPDWAGDWLNELEQCGLPRSDFVLTGFNHALDGWRPRAAKNHGIEKAVRALFVTQCGLSVEAAAELSPHMEFVMFLSRRALNLSVKGIWPKLVRVRSAIGDRVPSCHRNMTTNRVSVN